MQGGGERQVSQLIVGFSSPPQHSVSHIKGRVASKARTDEIHPIGGMPADSEAGRRILCYPSISHLARHLSTCLSSIMLISFGYPFNFVNDLLRGKCPVMDRGLKRVLYFIE